MGLFTFDSRFVKDWVTNEWNECAANVKPGDDVILETGVTHTYYELRKVRRVLATQIEIDYPNMVTPQKFARNGGKAWGDYDRDAEYIYPATPRNLEIMNAEMKGIECRLAADRATHRLLGLIERLSNLRRNAKGNTSATERLDKLNDAIESAIAEYQTAAEVSKEPDS